MFSCEAVHNGKGSILVFFEIFASNDKIFIFGRDGWAPGHNSIKFKDFSDFS